MGIMNAVPGLLDPIPGGKHLVNMLDYVTNWARANSLWPLTYGTSCCAIEMMSSSMARYDIARFGSEVFRASPRQADLFIIAGTITERMAPALQMLWEQIPGPKYAMAMGACTISGGPFMYDNYSVIRGANTLIPVDVFIPGCPPRPEALFHGLLTLRDKILSETFRDPWKEGVVIDKPYPDRWSEATKAWEELERIKDEEMAEARLKFKEEQPDYKSPYKIMRVAKEVFPEVPHKPKPLVGLPANVFFSIIKKKYPSVSPFDNEPSEVALAARPNDMPLDVLVSKEEYVEIIQFLKEDPRTHLDYLIDVTAVDWIDHFDVITQLMSIEKGHKLFVRLSLPKDDGIPEENRATSLLAAMPSIYHLYPAAEWKEREVFDMFGIHFENHPDERRLFVDEEFKGYPLRKDFTHPHILKRPV